MKFLTLIFLFAFSSSAICCPNILGTWKSSQEKSMNYNNHAGLEKKQLDLLNQILGYTTINYTETIKKHHKLPSVKFFLNDKEHNLTFEEMSFSYKLKSCDEHSIIIQFEDAEELKFVFVNPDTYWVSPKEVLSKSREYYVRISN